MFEKSVGIFQRSIERQNECGVAAILTSRLSPTKQGDPRERIYVTRPALLLSIKRGTLARKLFRTACIKRQGTDRREKGRALFANNKDVHRYLIPVSFDLAGAISITDEN